MNVNTFSQKDYENEPPSGPKKTNPIQTQFKPCPERSRTGQSRNNSRAGFMLSDWMVGFWSQSIVTGHKVIFGYVFFCLLSLGLFALSIVFLKQFSEVFVFSASGFKVEDLVFDTYPQVIQ